MNRRSGAFRRGYRKYKKALRKVYGDRCWWCKEHMFFNKPGHTMYASVEHLKRVADGGTNDFANLRLAHRKCNSER